MSNQTPTGTKVDTFLSSLRNNTITAIIIILGLSIITLAEVAQSGDSILRMLGLRKSYDINLATNRGRFSSSLLENAWNRMFWMRAYTERIRRNAPKEEIQQAWSKYYDATEKWSSNLMNYYLGLEEYYPNSNKRQILEGTIQPKFAQAGEIITRLKYSLDTSSLEEKIAKVDSAQHIVNEVNPDFYFLIDQPKQKKGG